ncbi:MAG: type II toxin-antitoxin system HicB family antitoxin [Acidobacteria bacterium]|nr:type II toxin-antitoxin system HicB family antitoxin [Acidobacteriota bacterium]
MSVAKYQYTVVIEQDEDGVYISSCPALQGCHSYGDTYEEALENIREVIQLHIEARQSVGDPIPIEVAVDRVEVTVEAAPGKTA